METGSNVAAPDHVPRDRVIDFDMFGDARLQEDPHEGYLRLRAEAPSFFWTPRNGGHWVALSQADIFNITHDTQRFTSFRQNIPALPPEVPAPRFVPVDMDPPEHTKYRMVLGPMLSPRIVAALEAESRRLAIELIEKVRAEGGCEFVEAVAMPMPVWLFMQMMGMPRERFEEFTGLVDVFFNTNDTNVRIGVYMKVMQFLGEMIAERRQAPGDDLISGILAAQVDGEPLSDEMVISMCQLLFVAGMDTVTNAMSFMLRALAENPELQQHLRENPARISDAVEEFLRRYAFANTIRMVREDTEYQGISLRKGEPVLVCLPMAGLDASFVDQPLTLDIDRPVKSHYVFGTGVHRCAGSHLARVELRVLLEEWLSRIPRFRLAGRPSFRPGIVMAVRELSLKW